MSKLDLKPKIKFKQGLSQGMIFFNLDCIYIDKMIPGACDLFGSANCASCKNYVRK